jgi:hypothetical protein
MATPFQGEGLARAAAMPKLHSTKGVTGTDPEPFREPVVLVVLPPLPQRCPRWGHRMLEGETACFACRALGLWPRLDRRKLSRAAPDLDRIARLAERSSAFDIVTIRGMLMRQRDQ